MKMAPTAAAWKNYSANGAQRAARAPRPTRMGKESSARSLSRRGILTLAGACLMPWEDLYAGDFWNKKDPSEWTGDEISELTARSPWAKPVTAQFAPGANNGGQSQGGGYPRNGGGMGGPSIGIGGIGIGMPRRGGMGRPGGYPQQSNYKGTVRWESAQPILDALKTSLPEAFANRYVIAVRDIPLLRNPSRSQSNPDDSDPDAPKLSTPDDDSSLSKRDLDELKIMTSLQPKGKESAQAGVVQQMTPGGSYFLFGFSREFLDFGRKDHEVVFSTQLGKLIVKAKFDPSEMMYRGTLAV
jgi:hypothetical protein